MKGGLFITLYDQMFAERQRLELQINSLHSQLNSLPSGKLFCCHNGAYLKWYQSDGKHQTYISKKNRHLAEQLAQKKYLTFLTEELTHEKRAIDFYLRHHSQNPQKSTQLLLDSPEYRELLSPFFKPLSQELLDWMNTPYEHNPKYPEQLIHKTSSGSYVRSKSEVLIDLALRTNKIPFRYECALQLNDTILFPDFTIRHPETGAFFYWEHFGMMDRPSYSQNAFSKLQLYTINGIIPTIQLITTYETKEHPLSPETVEKVIKDYFL